MPVYLYLQAGKYGLSNGCNTDRQFMIVTEGDMRKVTGRTMPTVVLISAVVQARGSALQLSAPDMPTITVSIPDTVSKATEVKTEVCICNCLRFFVII